MAYQHTNSKGHTYHLHSVTGRNGSTKLYHFARQAKDTGQEPAVPAGYTVSENPKTALPILKKAS